MTIRAYDKAAVRLHWASALLVVVLFAMGRLTGLMPRGPLRIDVWSVHLTLGAILIGLLAARLATRVKGPTPSAANPFAKLGHAVLYGLLILVLALGVINAFAHAFPLFNLVKLPQLGDSAFRASANLWHGWAANILIALALGHVLAAAVHYTVLKDDILARMIPGLRKRAA